MSKLSRKRRKQILQDSGDDFKEDNIESTSSLDKYTIKSLEATENEECPSSLSSNSVSNITLESQQIGSLSSCDPNEKRQNLPNCPFCSKDFKNSQVSQRTSHMKSCAKQMGISTTKLLEVMKLERKQADERKALGLKTPPPVQPKPRKKPSESTVSRRETCNEDDCGADPDLALALALSISAAAATSDSNSHENISSPVIPTTTESTSTCDPSSSKQMPAAASDNNEKSTTANKMWLPQADSQTGPKKRGRKNARNLAPTILETRSRIDRDRIIAERMGTILCPEVESSPAVLIEQLHWEGSRLCSTDLLEIQDKNCIIWRKANIANQLTPRKLMAEELSYYLTKEELKNSNKKSVPIENLQNNKDSTSNKMNFKGPIVESFDANISQEKGIKSLCKLSNDMLTLLKAAQKLKNKDAPGIVRIITKGEKSFFCHEIILKSRCPVLLQEMIVEHNEDSSESYIVMSNYTLPVIQVAMEYIYAGVFNIDKLNDKVEFNSIKSLAKQIGLKELSDCLNEMQVEEVSDYEGNETNNTISDEESEEKEESLNETSNDNLNETSNDALNALLSVLSQEDIEAVSETNDLVSALSQKDNNEIENDNIEECNDQSDEEWESLCIELTQKRRQSTISSDDSLEEGDKSDNNFDSDLSFEDQEDNSNDIVSKLDKIAAELSPKKSNDKSTSFSGNVSYPIDDESNKEVEDAMNNESDDEIIDLTQDKELSSPDIFAESDSDSPVDFQSKYDHEKSSKEVNKESSKTPNETNFDASSLMEELPTPSPVKSRPILKSNSDVSLNVSPISTFSDNNESFLPVTPKSDKTNQSISRKRILSSQDSLNPRSLKKVKSFVLESSMMNTESEVTFSTNENKKPQTNLEILQQYKEALETSEKECVLEKLLDIEVTVDDLLQTGIGKNVKRLKIKKGRVGELAKELFYKWMGLVENHISTQSQQPLTQNVETNENDQVEEYDYGEERNIEENINNDDHESFQENLENPPNNSDKNIQYESIENTPNENEIDDLGSSFSHDAFEESFNDENNQNVNNINEKYKDTPPVNKRLMLERTPKCTPLPEYDKYLSPELKAELRKYGLKAVPRKKAILFLTHIYDETHPEVNSRGSVVKNTPLVQKNKKEAALKNKAKKKLAVTKEKSLTKIKKDESKLKKNAAKDASKIVDTEKSAKPSTSHQEDDENIDEDFVSLSQCSQQSYDENDVPEETFLGLGSQRYEDDLLSQVPNEGSLFDQLKEFIRSRPSLHQDILLYRPIWLGEFIKDVKESGIKCKQDQIVDFFDKMCITFRFENRNKKSPKKKSPRKSPKKSPKKVGKKLSD